MGTLPQVVVDEMSDDTETLDTVETDWAEFICDVTPQHEDSRHEVILDDKCLTKLIIKPGIWFGFQGLNSPHSIVMNLIDSVHDPKESEKMKKEDLNFNW